MNEELILRQIQQYLSLRDGECHKCKDAGRKMFMCSSCAAVSYCGAECQRKHWAQHQLVCAKNGGKGKEERKDNPLPEEPPAIQFGTLPADVIQLLVERLSREDLQTFRQVDNFFARHPRVIQQLQNEYVYLIRDLDQILPENPIDWTRKIQKIRYDDRDQQVINQLQHYFDPNRIRELYLRDFTGDISPLSGLTQLRVLYLGSFYGDISPLSGLTQLRVLVLMDFDGDSIEPLRGLTQLRELSLFAFNGDSIDPLSRLTQLQTLILGSFTGDSIEPLSGLRRLQTLSLQEFTGDISPLREFTQLRELRLNYFNGDSIKPLSGLTQLRVLDLRSFVGDISPLSGLSQLQWLNLSSFRGVSIEPLSGLTQLQELYLSSFRGDISPLSGLTQLRSLILSRNNPHHSDWKEYLAQLRQQMHE